MCNQTWNVEELQNVLRVSSASRHGLLDQKMYDKTCQLAHIIVLALAFGCGVGSRLASSQESVVGQCPCTTWPRTLELQVHSVSLQTAMERMQVSGVDYLQETSALAHQRAVSPSFRPSCFGCFGINQVLSRLRTAG